MKTLKKKVFLIVPLILLFFSLIPPLEASYAYFYYDITTETDFIAPSNPALSSIHMANGKYIYVSGRNAMTSNLDVYVFNVDGDLLAHSTITIPLWDLAVDRWITDISLYDNDTQLFIFGGGWAVDHNPTYSAWGFSVAYDTTAYTSVVEIEEGISCSINPDINLSMPFYYDGFVYVMWTLQSAQEYVYVLKKNVTDTTAEDISIGIDNDTPFDGTIFGFQNITDTDKVYVIAGKDGDPSRPTYWVWDLDGDTVTEIADTPTDYHWRAVGNYISLRYFGGGIHYKEDGDAILYHTWGWCDAFGDLEIIQHRIEFDAGNISTAEIENQNTRNVIFGQSEYLAIAEVSFGGGYMISKDEFNVFRVVQREGESGVFYTVRSEISVYDFENFVLVDLDVDFEIEDNSVVSQGVYNRIFKIMTSSMQTTEKSDELNVYIYYGLADSSWSVSWTIAPDDNPLLTNKNYTYYCEVRKEGALQAAEIFILFDFSTFLVKNPDDGEFDFWSIVSVSGYHTWSFVIYQSGNWEATVVKSKYYEQFGDPDPTDPTGEGWLPNPPLQPILWIFDWLPTLVVLGFFSGVGWMIIGGMGLVGGFVSGVFVLVNFGDLPIWTLFFLILSSILLVMFKLKKPSISMNGGGA